MCLAQPCKVLLVDTENQAAEVSVCGSPAVRKTVSLFLLETPVAVDDWVLVHVGFAEKQIHEVEALETIRLLEAMEV